MTRIFVQRGSVGSSSNANRPSSLSAPQPSKEEEEKAKDVLEDSGDIVEIHGTSEDKTVKNVEAFHESSNFEGGRVTNRADECLDKKHSVSAEGADSGAQTRDSVGSGVGSSRVVTTGGSYPPPPPVPPPRPSSLHTNVRRMGPSRRSPVWSVSGSRPTSPRAYGEGEGYNSADEQSPCYGSAYDDAEKERMFEHEIRRTRGYEVKRMLEDGNCLFRAVADQVYGDPEGYDMVRQMCIDYMERERDHFSQFITEGFTSYCKRKRRDKVYGNNAEIQAFAEMYNRPIHIFCYSTEPINIFHGNYNTDTPPIRLSYHHGNHYNSLVDPSRLAIGAGLGFSSLQGANIDRDRVKAVIRAQQDQQIDNALIAEGRFYSDLELTEKEMERMVMEASRTEYLAEEKLKLQLGSSESSTSGAEPSSSGTRFTEGRKDKEQQQQDTVLSSSMQMLLSMGFSYLQVVEAYSIFGDDVDSMVCYLLEMGRGGSSSRRKGKAAE